MLQTLCEGSEVVERNDHYFPAYSDSPDTKRSKLKQIWKDQDEFVESLTHSLAAGPLPSSAPSSSADMTWPMSSDSPRTRCRKLEDIWNEQDALVNDLLLSPAKDEDPIEDFEAEPPAAVNVAKKERPVKYGRCPEHRVPLYPHLHTSPKARAWGCIYLRCQNFKERNAVGKPSCWFARLLKDDEKELVPKALLEAQRQIKANVAWQLRNA
jgi:hypothetical protein